MTTDFVERAKQLDEKYPSFKDKFVIPTAKTLGVGNTDEQSVYLCGNSLGLMPKATETAVQAELDAWKERAVTGHFNSKNGSGWMSIDEEPAKLFAPIVGAKDESEVAIMQTLTGNLHHMLSTFYQPDGKRYKILYEEKAFPSDQYAFEGQVRLHGYKPEDALVMQAPREGEFCLRTEDILKTIEEQGDEISVVIFSAIQYYTGQLFDIEKITAAAHAKGCIVGWDCAHAGGNVPLKLHDWDVDFAVFCTYKYMNAGPGAIGAIFVNSRFADGTRPRQAGWWGNKPENRFQMRAQFDPSYGAAGFKMSNPTVISVVCVRESLKLFHEFGGIEKMRERSISMTNLMWDMLTSSRFYVPVEKLAEQEGSKAPAFTIITPSRVEERGAQLSLLFLPLHSGTMQKVFADLESHAVIGDEREPDVIRLAPNHLYNTHADVVKAVGILENSLASISP